MRKFPVLTKPPYRTPQGVTTPRHLLLIAGGIVETCLRLSFGFAETTYARLLAVFNFQLSTFNFQLSAFSLALQPPCVWCACESPHI